MMVRSGKSVCLSALRRSLVWSCVALIAALCGTLCAQDTGKNAVISSGGSPVPSPSFLDATQFSVGVDPCQAISATFGHLPTTGGTVDARGLAGTSSTLICSVNPIPSGARGRLLLGSGTYLAQVPWVIQSNNINVIGTGASGDTGNNNTIIQACASGQANCGSSIFPSGHAVIQMGTSGQTVMRSTVKELAVDCQDVPGVSGFQAVNAQEETVIDLVRVTGCRVAAFDIGVGDNNDQNGAALSNFDVGYPAGQGCPTVVPGMISSISRDNTGLVTVVLTTGLYSPTLEVGYEVVISNVVPASFNGTYRVNPPITILPPGFTYQQQSTTVASASNSGQIALFPVGVRVWQATSSAVRPIVNGTINGSMCPQSATSKPPIAMELSGGDPFVHNVHAEGFTVGIQIGDLTQTNGVTLTNVKPENNTVTGIQISDQWKLAGAAPGALPTGNIDIFNLDAGGGNVDTNSIKDLINGNTLTQTGSNLAVGYYLVGPGGVMTSAKPEPGLVNGFDVNGQNVAIYSGSANAVFSAGPSGMTTSRATNSATYNTATNCASSSGSCGSAAAGQVSTGTSTLTVSTSAVTANSEIHIQEDTTLGSILGVTCNTTKGRTYTVTSKTANTSFVITASAAPTSGAICLTYRILN
jgi:hypothetical protein